MARKLRLAVNTGGGDAPGLNAVLRAVTLSALNRGFEVIGIRKGYLGLLDTSQLVPLTFETVRGITHLGGPILGTNNRGNPLAVRVVEEGRVRRDSMAAYGAPEMLAVHLEEAVATMKRVPVEGETVRTARELKRPDGSYIRSFKNAGMFPVIKVSMSR